MYFYHGTNERYLQFLKNKDSSLRMDELWSSHSPYVAIDRAHKQAAKFDSEPVVVIFKREETLRVLSAGEQHYHVSGEIKQDKYALFWPEKGIAEFDGEIKKVPVIDLEDIMKN